MKRSLLLLFTFSSLFINAQTFISIGSDGQGDGLYSDAKELFYYYNSAEDTLYVKIETHNQRSNGGDFGYALAIDTNLDPTDGQLPHQNGLQNQTPNTSMNFDIMLFAYQNGFFPGIFKDAIEGSGGNPVSIDFAVDTSDLSSFIFGIPVADIGGDVEVNLVAFTGSFDIGPGQGGPSDAMPDATFSSVRKSGIGISEKFISPLDIYPNPAKSSFRIKGLTGQKLVLVNLQGIKVLEWEQTDGKAVDCSKLPSGLYLVHTEEGSSLGKVMVK